MVLDPRKLQKKKEKRNAKHRAHMAARRAQPISRVDDVLSNPDRYPVLDCCMAATLFDSGMGHVLLTRALPNRQVVGAMFLVDAYCMGVKNALTFTRAQGEYEREILKSPMFEQMGREDIDPASARKLLEGAVAYAQSIGLAPHPDYRLAKMLFGSTSVEDSDRKFVFGKDGKPLFVAGPFETPEAARAIITILSESCGPDNFEYFAPALDLDDEW